MSIPLTIPKLYFLYRLIDPCCYRTIYIGCTTNPNKRMYRHIECKEYNEAKNTTIREVIRHGCFPHMAIEDILYSDQRAALKAEARLIQNERKHNPNLTNIAGTEAILEDDGKDYCALCGSEPIDVEKENFCCECLTAIAKRETQRQEQEEINNERTYPSRRS